MLMVHVRSRSKPSEPAINGACVRSGEAAVLRLGDSAAVGRGGGVAGTLFSFTALAGGAAYGFEVSTSDLPARVDLAFVAAALATA
jgi:hypothetical protein